MQKLIRNVGIRSCFSTQTNYFKLFNLPFDFSQQQLKASYLQLVKKHHPDLTPDPLSHQIFKQVQIGYEVLSDKVKRNQHQTQQKERSQNIDTEDSNAKSVYQQMKDKFYTNYVQKDPINDEFNFSYKLFKEHYEKVEAPKAAYQKYQSSGTDHYYERNDEKGQQLWKQVGAGLSALGVIGLAFAYTHS